jgi:hypothetical protein
MSHWRAFAEVSNIPESDLRERLIAALETLHYIAADLECEVTETAILESLDELRNERDSATSEMNEADNRAAIAEERLEKRIQSQPDPALIVQVTRERDDALAQLAGMQPLIDAYSDCLAFARTFVSKGEAAGLKTRHVRSTTKKRRTG